MLPFRTPEGILADASCTAWNKKKKVDFRSWLIVLKLIWKKSNSFVSVSRGQLCTRKIYLVDWMHHLLLASGQCFNAIWIYICKIRQKYGTCWIIIVHGHVGPRRIWNYIHVYALSQYLLWYAHKSKFCSDSTNFFECNLHFGEHFSVRDASNGGCSCHTLAPIERSNAEKEIDSWIS